MKAKFLIVSTAAFFPLFAFAAQRPTTFKELVGVIINFINSSVIPLLFALAFLTFLWGVFRYFVTESEVEHAKARDIIVYGIGGLAIMIAFAGIVLFVQRSLFGSSSDTISGGSGQEFLTDGPHNDFFNDIQDEEFDPFDFPPGVFDPNPECTDEPDLCP